MNDVQPKTGDPGADNDAVLAILSHHDDDLADLVELVATICAAEAAGITIRRHGDYHVPITYGLEPFVSPSTDTFCQHTMGSEGVFAIEDARADPRFAGIGWVDGTIASARFYASAPIYSPAGAMVGRLCVIDSTPRTLTSWQRDSLETLAASVTQLIELRLLRSDRPSPTQPGSGQRAATVVSHLAAELSHDLRVPLSSIRASVEMLQEELGDQRSPVVEALLTRALRAAGRMDRMLDQVLEHGATAPRVAPTETDLSQLTHQLVLDSSTLLEGAGANVVAADLPVVRANADEMYSVLQNLLTNAVKFARPGVPPEVHLSARRTAQGWRISVRDNGLGIPEDRRTDVFSLFSRAHSGVEGHGIGLATVARIVEARGGRTGADPVPDGGAEIWFELPDEPGDRDDGPEHLTTG